MRRLRAEDGFSIIENLVAITLLAVAAASTVPLMGMSYNASGAVREQSAILAEVEEMFSQYQTQSLSTTLSNINSSIAAINDGDSVSIASSSATTQASYTVTLTAIKSSGVATPEAVYVQIDVSQPRGIFDTRNYSFETVITQLG